ncbi:MAG: GH3 auxin-responsive promoter family protein [Cyanothece sp. SIO1E1]|nr:GH3 auxin-responsive promoter family protein [Cyanothece sp. SIO1E1]
MVNPLISMFALATRQAKKTFVRQTRRASAVQAQFLQQLLQVQQNTVLGQQLKLAKIATVEQFREQVPIWPYANYEPYINRMTSGEPNILTPDPVHYIYLSSGSTGSCKLVPVTRRSKQSVERAGRAAMGFALEAAQNRGLPLGKILLTASAKPIGHTDSGIAYGHISSTTTRLSNVFYRQLFAQPFEALLPVDSLARNYVCLLFALQNPDLAIIGASFPIVGLKLCEYLEHYAESLIADLERGAIADWLNLEPELRTTLNRQFSATPRRAAQLRHLLQTETRLTPKLAWPQLSFLVTALGGTSNFYLERFADYFGNAPTFGGTYAATEATFGVHHNFNTDATILAIESGFFEFIPADQWGQTIPKTLLPHEVKVGEYYRILVTSYAGFYRYDIGDVVEVAGFFEQAPLIIFRHRQGGTLSAITEKTTEYHVMQVMAALQQEYNLHLEDFCITLSEDITHAHYIFNIELLPEQTLAEPRQFLVAFDRKLQAANISYALKRANHDIPGPCLRFLAPGSFATLRQRQLGSGLPNTQMKFPHTSNDPTLLAGIKVERELQFPEEMIMEAIGDRR